MTEGRRCGACKHWTKFPSRESGLCECVVPIFASRIVHLLPTDLLLAWREMTPGDGEGCPCWAEKEAK